MAAISRQGLWRAFTVGSSRLGLTLGMCVAAFAVAPPDATTAAVTRVATRPESPLATAKGSLTLVSESPAFVASQQGVELGLTVSSPLPVSSLSIEVALFSDVTARYTLGETLGGTLPDLLTPLGTPGVIPLGLKSLSWTSGGTLMLHLPLAAPDLPGQAGTKDDTGTGGVILSIPDCTPGNCGGVYPLQVSLLNSGTPIASLTTYVVVTPPSEVSGTHPLDFAWVMPLGSSPAISPSGMATSDPTDLAELSSLHSDLSTDPHASISLEVFSQFVESLRYRDDAASKTALSELRSLAGPGGQAAILAGPFAPDDPGELLSSGLSSGVAEQVVRSRQVLSPDISFQAHDYALNGPIPMQALGILQRLGVTRIIAPNDAVTPLQAAFAEWTPTAPFIIPGSGVEAMDSDPLLESILSDDASPALKAEQLLASLSVQYFDDSGVPQAMALESPLGTPIDTTFLAAMLSGLSASPIIRAVTLPTIFDTVSPGSSNTSPDERPLLVQKSPSVLSAAAVATAETQVAALGSVNPGLAAPHGRPPLGDLILMSEDSLLTSAQQAAYLATLGRRAADLAHVVTLPVDRTITVTSLQAKVPISIVSSATTAFVADLEVSSTGLGFPRGHSFRVTLYPHTNIVQILLAARTSGDFPLEMTLTTTTGFTLASGNITIRSTAISGVAVALSIGAAAFLLIWWGRSIIAKRRRDHRRRGAELASSLLRPSSDTAA